MVQKSMFRSVGKEFGSDSLCFTTSNFEVAQRGPLSH